MRALNFLPDGVRRKFDVATAQNTGHFQVFVRLAQGDGHPAVGTGNLLANVLGGEPDMPATSGTKHFHQPGRCVTPGGKLARSGQLHRSGIGGKPQCSGGGIAAQREAERNEC